MMTREEWTEFKRKGKEPLPVTYLVEVPFELDSFFKRKRRRPHHGYYTRKYNNERALKYARSLTV